MGLRLVVSITHVFPPSWIFKPKYDCEIERSMRNQRGGLLAYTMRGIWEGRVGKEIFSPFYPVCLNALSFLNICNSSQLC